MPEAIPMQPQRPALLPILQRPATLVREDAAADDAGVGFLGEHHVAAFGPSGRRWGLDGLKRPLVTDFPIASAPRFTPHAYRDPTRLVVQTTAARRLLIDATTGRVVADVPTARRPWLSPPARAGDSVVAADGPAKLTAFDPATGAIRWQADAGREPSQTGDPAQAVAVEGAILSAVARNYGVELDRLHADTGRSTWAAGPALVPAAAFDLTAADADADRVYVPLPDRLVALRADTGREVWSSPLPFAADWRAAVSRNAVVVYPGQTQPVEPADPFAAFARLPRADRGFRLLAAGFDAWLTRSIPVLLLDPTTGHLIQRLDVPARGPVVRATVRADGVAVRAGAERFVLK